MNKDIRSHILSEIKENNITPLPRWRFVLLDSLHWLLALVVLAIGSISIATILSIIIHSDWDIATRLYRSRIGFFLHIAPYLWILLTILFLWLAEYLVRRSHGGYRYALWQLLGGVLLFSMIGGSLLYYVGIGTKVDNHFGERSELYNRFAHPRAQQLHRPEDGVLAGKVLTMSGSIWTLQDKDGETWTLDLSSSTIRGAQFIQQNKPIRVLGELQNEQSFLVEEIMPLRPPHTFRRDHGPRLFQKGEKPRRTSRDLPPRSKNQP